MKNNNNSKCTCTAAEYAAVKIAKEFVEAISYYNEEEQDELLKAYPAFNEISADDISYLICGCGGWSRSDEREEIAFLASKVRKANFILGTALMVVLEKGLWFEYYFDETGIIFDNSALNWHFNMPTTAECCREMHAARKRLHAKVCRPYIPYIADDDLDPEDDWDPEWDN